MTSREATDGRAHADYLRGADEGARLAQASVPLPPLQGGPYAVGLLYGYSSARRAHVGSVQSDTRSAEVPLYAVLCRPATQELVDDELHEEITSLADVMTAVADASGALSQDEIDEALGLSRDRDEDDPVTR